ncbi:MAG: hypothetical protein HQK86_07950 [Nitrospinae bacterium]|nr:hypothetical protein [Nitrospinota bacterium]
MTPSRFLMAVLPVSLFIFCGVSFAEESPWERKLPFKSAIVQYDVAGDEKGTETLYIRASGQEQVHVRKTKGKVMFMNVSNDKVTITTPELVTEVDMEKKTGRKFINPNKFMSEEYGKLSAKEKENVKKNAVDMGTNMSQMMGGTVEKKAGSHLGYPCDVVKAMGITTLVMSDSGIMLKTDGSMMGMTIKSAATKLEKDAAIPSDVFNVPAGINVQYDKEADKSNREMAKSVMDMLKDPEASKKMSRDMENVGRERDKGMKESRAERKKAEKERASEPRKEETSSDKGEADKKEDQPAKEEENSPQDAIKKGLGAIKKLF